MNQSSQDWAAAKVATSALLATLDHVSFQLRGEHRRPPEHMPDFMKEFFAAGKPPAAS